MVDYEAAAIALFHADKANLTLGGEFHSLADHVQAAYRAKARQAVDAAMMDIDNHVNRDLNALMVIAQLRPDQSQTMRVGEVAISSGS